LEVGLYAFFFLGVGSSPQNMSFKARLRNVKQFANVISVLVRVYEYDWLWF